jgi:hypothetical protein
MFSIEIFFVQTTLLLDLIAWATIETESSHFQAYGNIPKGDCQFESVVSTDHLLFWKNFDSIRKQQNMGIQFPVG